MHASMTGVLRSAVLGIGLLGGLAGCGLSNAEDDWCTSHLAEVERAVPEDQRRDMEYRDDTWKDACRRAYERR